MIRVLFIDVDDTLLDFDKCSAESMNLAAREMEIDLPEDFLTVFHRENDKIWQRLEKGMLTMEELFRIRFQTIFKAAGIEADGVLFESLFRKNLERTAVPVEHALDFLKAMKGRYLLYAASNGPYHQQASRLAQAGMDVWLDGIFVSEEVGFSKPKKEFFDVCFSRLGDIKPEESMMVGDSLTADIGGAHDYGMRTCWLNRKHKKPSDPNIINIEIDSLQELCYNPDIIGRI